MAIEKRDLFRIVERNVQDVDADDVRTAVDDLRTTIGGAGFAAVETAISGKYASLPKANRVRVLIAILQELASVGDATILATVESDWPASMQALDDATKMRLTKTVFELMSRKGLDEIPD